MSGGSAGWDHYSYGQNAMQAPPGSFDQNYEQPAWANALSATTGSDVAMQQEVGQQVMMGMGDMGDTSSHDWTAKSREAAAWALWQQERQEQQ
eukprot:TRINITY_DN28553_c0_g1_i1.p1 TRINITY_DN28553_c0_g1~~TRINITY_DN28553_c0_g1_i1.p1  ORF type:complete len:102 (+),score=30.52 TRINITY_DN28553_c0_g1_i1:30-308(+)